MKLVQADGRLDESIILESAKAVQFEETAAALALLCSAPIELIDQLMRSNRIDSLLIPCKPADWAGREGGRSLTPAHGATSEAAFETAKRDYANLSLAAAQRIIRFWHDRT